MIHHNLPEHWQAFAHCTLSVGRENRAQTQALIAEALKELYLPPSVVADLVGAVGTALLALTAPDHRQQRAAITQAIIEILMPNRPVFRLIAPGWGFFLVEKRAGSGAGDNGSPPHRLTVYLYQENGTLAC